MKHVHTIQYHANTKEEQLPGYDKAFPYISSTADLCKYPDAFVPWHWHKAVELFIVKSGTVTYYLPGKEMQFHEGEGGFLNSDILHMTKPGEDNTIQVLHLFDPSLIAGSTNGTLYRKYVFPLVNNTACDIFRFPKDSSITKKIMTSFSIPEDDAFEMKIRNALSEIWLEIRNIANSEEMQLSENRTDTKLKEMIAFIYENYANAISVKDIAESAYLSERECYRVFKEFLHTTPNAFLNNYRIDASCELLRETDKTIASIGYETGLGTSSHFIQVFRKAKGCTPQTYRMQWQNRETH